MPELLTDLRRHARVGYDTSVFIYLFEGEGRYAQLARITLLDLANGTIMGTTSVLSLMELAVQPLRLGRRDLARTYEHFVRNLPNMRVVDIGPAVARHAAKLRAQHRLGSIDAIQLAASRDDGATAFVTNDRRLRRVTEIEILVLDDYLPTGASVVSR